MKLLVHHPVQGLNPGKHIIQVAHDAPWIGAQSLNTGPRLATPGGAPLRQFYCRSPDVVSILANARFWVRDWPIYGPGTGYLLDAMCRAHAHPVRTLPFPLFLANAVAWGTLIIKPQSILSSYCVKLLLRSLLINFSTQSIMEFYFGAHLVGAYVQLDCPSVRHWDYVIIFAVEV